MPDQEMQMKIWDAATLEVYDEDGVRQRLIGLKDVHVMVRGEGVEYAVVTGRVEDVRLGPPRRGRPRKKK